MSLFSRATVELASLFGAMFSNQYFEYSARVMLDAVCCGCCLQLSSKSTACSLSHFSVCFGVMPAGGCTVCCMDLSLFPAQS